MADVRWVVAVWAIMLKKKSARYERVGMNGLTHK